LADDGEDSTDRMSFLDHLEELRSRLIRSSISLLVGFALCFGFAERIFHFMTQPLRTAYPEVQFIATEPTETFMLYMKMAFFAGIFLAAPFVLYQVWAFIAPGLYAHEKAYAAPFILFGTVFFVMGGLFGHYVLFPRTFSFLVDYGGQDVKFMPKVSEYYSFYSWFVLGLGLVFQLPVVMFVLSRIGLVTAGFLLRQTKYAFLACFVVSAVITPSGDIVNQTALAVPMMGLYLFGVLVAWMFGRPRKPPGDDKNENIDQRGS
jgi:sec-independent protein translocase protein TatC